MAAVSDEIEHGRRLDLKLVFGNIVHVSAPAYVLGVFDNVNPTGAARWVDGLLNGALSILVQDRMIGSRRGEISLLPTPRRALRADIIAFAGLGPVASFRPKVLETVSKNLARVFVTTQIHSFATVVIGSNSGASVKECCKAMLDGFLTGLIQSDPDHDFRTLYICESNPERYEELQAAAYSYSPPKGLEKIYIARRKLDFSNLVAPILSFIKRDAWELTYLTVEQRQQSSQGHKYKLGVLSGGSGPVITPQDHDVDFFGKKAIHSQLNAARQLDPEFGLALSELYLPTTTRDAMLESLRKARESYLVVVHDRSSADIPWEAMRIADDYYPAIEAGVSRKLSVEAALAPRASLSRSAKLRMLIVRNPTRNLPGAEVECDEIVRMFKQREVEPKVLAHEAATASAIVDELKTNDYDILHYAGHAIFDPRYYGNSGLICHGKERLNASRLGEIETLPPLVVLNGCQSLRVRGEDGEEYDPFEPPPGKEDDRFFWEKIANTLGEQASLAEAMMLRGAMNVVGTYWPVADAAAQVFACNFYASLISGDRLGLALRKARHAIRDLRSGDWANYLHYGDPEYLIRRP